MDTRSLLFTLRTQAGLSQEALAERVFVTRQAVSRWENGADPELILYKNGDYHTKRA